MSIEEKRGLVYELARTPNAAFEMLQSWSRQEILQILCSELGRERKYTGLTKLKIIENLIKVVTDKNSIEEISEPRPPPPFAAAMTSTTTTEESKNVPNTQKRQKKSSSSSDRHCHTSSSPGLVKGDGDSCSETRLVLCANSACRAGLSFGDKFCKRCSCCVCHKFDDNKDPSLWLTCGEEDDGDGCNLSCHLECALKKIEGRVDEVIGDGCLRCVSCGKMNDMLRCWRKQLAIAMEARRVDILCYRVSLSRRLLVLVSKKYESISRIVEEAASKLEDEVGSLSAVKMGRGIVNRMSCGHEVQRLCASAVDSLDKIMTTNREDCHQTQRCWTLPVLLEDSKVQAVNNNNNSSSSMRFEDIGATCVTLVLDPPSSYNPTTGGCMLNNVCYSMWHRKADDDKDEYRTLNPTCTIFPPQTQFFVSGLTPSTKYIFKVVCFDGSTELSCWETRLTTKCDDDDSSSKIVDLDLDHVPGSTTERSQSPVTNCSTLTNPSSIEDETNNITCTSFINNSTVEDDQCMNNCSEKKDENNVNARNSLTGTADHQDKADCEQTCTGQSGAALIKCEDSPLPKGDEAASSPSDVSKSPTGMEIVPFGQELTLPMTPCQSDMILDTCGRNRGQPINISGNKDGSEEEFHPRRRPLKRRRKIVVDNKEEQECGDDPDPSSSIESDLEHYVKVMRWLECEGYIEKSFRQKFLTWYSLRATPQEARVVKVFVSVFTDDPASLAEQIIDAFGEIVTNGGSSSKTRELTAEVPSGFCMKLWH